MKEILRSDPGTPVVRVDTAGIAAETCTQLLQSLMLHSSPQQSAVIPAGNALLCICAQGELLSVMSVIGAAQFARNGATSSASISRACNHCLFLYCIYLQIALSR